MKPICFIGARGGSKGVPKKNIRSLAGKPLIAHAIETSIESKIYSHVIVSTDDTEIARVAKKYGAEIPFMRPKRLATSTVGMIEVLVHDISKLLTLGYKFDIFVNRDCTLPFISSSDAKGAVKLLQRTNCDEVVAVYRQHLNPYFNMVEYDRDGFLQLSKSAGERPRSRQYAPPVYQLTGLYVFNAKKFLNKPSVIMPKTLPYEIPLERGLMIDTEFEFRIAELLLKHKILKIS